MGRISLECEDPSSLLSAKERIEKIPGAILVGVKNTFDPEFKSAPSHYRDVKLLLNVEFSGFDSCWLFSSNGQETVGLKEWTPECRSRRLTADGRIRMVCEVQMQLPTWTRVKKLTGIHYKIRRS